MSESTNSQNPGFKFAHSYASLPEIFFTPLPAEPVSAPEMVLLNHDLAADMGLDFSTMSEQAQAAMFAGNVTPAGAKPIAQAYAGHQFGNFTNLGDGRAVSWGEHITPDGRRLDIQFKGSGRTPYSRGGDGRAALGPMLREYIISEAMHALGIPTTRSLAVVTTGEEVFRDTPLPGAIMTRVAASHIRVGTFEFAAAHQDKALIKALLDYTIGRHYPGVTGPLDFLRAVMERQADLVANWMRVGFIHGVMNTDNMALSGETIDYGPCAFMDAYNAQQVFSSIDMRGRYAFANQPKIAQWNLARLGEALLPLVDEDIDKAVDRVEEVILGFTDLFQQKWLAMMRAKLGLFGAQPEDEKLAKDVLDWMQRTGADYTNTFRSLSAGDVPTGDEVFEYWHLRWLDRLDKNPADSNPKSLMQRSNPAVIPRNHKVEQALDAATAGHIQPLYDLLDALSDPYSDRAGRTPYQTPPTAAERVHQTFCGT